MKKILFILLCFCFMLTVKADSGGREVIFVYNDNSFSSAVKTFAGGRTLLSVSYRSAVNDLSPSQLAEILNQTSNTNAGKLYVYGTVKVKVNPTSGGNYDRLLEKTTVYQGISDPVWQDSDTVTIDKSTSAAAKTFDSNMYIPIMNVYYRETTDDEWTRTTNFTLDESRTLESQLAELLSIDLDANPNGVVSTYNDLYKFEALDDTYVATTRFDFYDKKDDSTPELVSGSTDKYAVSSLDYIDSEYLIMKFTAPAGQTAAPVAADAKSGSTFTKVILVTCLLAILGGGSYYLKKNNLISFE